MTPLQTESTGALQAHIDAGRTALTTAQAALVLGFKDQTLRKWACYDNGPGGLRPIKIGRSLRWLIDDLIRVLSRGVP